MRPDEQSMAVVNNSWTINRQACLPEGVVIYGSCSQASSCAENERAASTCRSTVMTMCPHQSPLWWRPAVVVQPCMGPVWCSLLFRINGLLQNEDTAWEHFLYSLIMCALNNTVIHIQSWMFSLCNFWWGNHVFKTAVNKDFVIEVNIWLNLQLTKRKKHVDHYAVFWLEERTLRVFRKKKGFILIDLLCLYWFIHLQKVWVNLE